MYTIIMLPCLSFLLMSSFQHLYRVAFVLSSFDGAPFSAWQHLFFSSFSCKTCNASELVRTRPHPLSALVGNLEGSSGQSVNFT